MERFVNSGTQLLRRCLIGLAIGGLLIAYLWFHPEIWHGPNWPSREIYRRGSMLMKMGLTLERYREAHEGQIPNTLEELRADIPDWLIQEDAQGERIWNRAVFLRDVRGSSGLQYAWVLLVLLPKDRPPPRYDVIFTENRPIACHPCTYFP